jgi:hypothetical protein
MLALAALGDAPFISIWRFLVKQISYRYDLVCGMMESDPCVDPHTLRRESVRRQTRSRHEPDEIDRYLTKSRYVSRGRCIS